MFSTIYGYEGRLQVLMRNLITCPDLVCDPLTACRVIDNARTGVERDRSWWLFFWLEGQKNRKKQWSMTNVYQVCLVFLYWHLSILSLWLSHLQGKCRACLLSSCNLTTQPSSPHQKYWNIDWLRICSTHKTIKTVGDSHSERLIAHII